MAKDQSPVESAFYEALEEHKALVAETPVDNAAMHHSITNVEARGAMLLVEKPVLAGTFAEGMHQMYLSAVTIEVVPPYSEEQLADLGTKIALYAGLVEHTAAKKAQTKATPTEGTKTDKPKR